MNNPETDAPRLVPEDVLDRLDDMMCDCKADGSLTLAESVANEHGEDLQMLLTAYRNLAAAPAVQPAAGREEIARALDLLNEARNGGFFIGTDAGAKVEEAKDVLRDILAAISTPAQASGEPVAWQRLHPTHGWRDMDAEDVDHYRAQGQQIRGLYAHPPAQASESGGEMLGRITQALVRADEEFGNSLSAYRYRKLAEAVAALSAPQAAPGEGEQS